MKAINRTLAAYQHMRLWRERFVRAFKTRRGTNFTWHTNGASVPWLLHNVLGKVLCAFVSLWLTIFYHEGTKARRDTAIFADKKKYRHVFELCNTHVSRVSTTTLRVASAGISLKFLIASVSRLCFPGVERHEQDACARFRFINQILSTF